MEVSSSSCISLKQNYDNLIYDPKLIFLFLFFFLTLCSLFLSPFFLSNIFSFKIVPHFGRLRSELFFDYYELIFSVS